MPTCDLTPEIVSELVSILETMGWSMMLLGALVGLVCSPFVAFAGANLYSWIRYRKPRSETEFY